ncbi:MAG: hypothetical protein ACREOG_16255 [Gemmatimonadaceae bacterium]
MSQEPNDSLDALRQLPREVTPDASVEQRTIAALRAQSLLHVPLATRRFNLMPWLFAASIAAIAFVTGVATGRARSRPASPEPSFALMLYGASTGDDSSAHERRADEYRRWASDEHAWGRIIGGEALGDRVSGLAGADTSASKGRERDDLVGFFLIDAPNREAALRLAADCPHLKYGGRIVVREVQRT